MPSLNSDDQRRWCDRSSQALRVAVVAALLALAGCVAPARDPFGVAFLPDHEARLRLPHDAARSAETIVHREPFEYSEYRRVDARRGRSEAVLVVANAPQTALDLSVYRLQALTRGFVFNAAPARLAWRSQQLLRGRGRAVRYARFARRAGKRAPRRCVAFVRGWAIPPDDPRQRIGKAYFGYHCAPTTAVLSDAAARRYIRRISVDTKGLRRVRYGDRVADQRAARRRARGLGSARWGYSDFPLRRSRRYHVRGGATVH